jgi:hypothetical protein
MSAELQTYYNECGERGVRGRIFPYNFYSTSTEFIDACNERNILDRPRDEIVHLCLSSPRLTHDPSQLIDLTNFWKFLPVSTQTDLYPFQRIVIERIIQVFDGRVLLAAEMGMGKTIMTILAMYYYSVWDRMSHRLVSSSSSSRSLPPLRFKKVLIVCPLGMLDKWEEEIEKWCGTEHVSIKILKDTTKDPLGEHITICTFGNVRVNKNVHEQEWPILIVDESQEIKNPESLQGKAVARIATRSRAVFMLSATPRQNCSSELYNQIVPLLGEHVLGSYEGYCVRYAQAHYDMKFGKKTLLMGKPRHQSELNALLSHCMIRLNNKEANLPPKRRFLVQFALDETTPEFQEFKLAQTNMRNAPTNEKRDQYAQECWRTTTKAKIPFAKAWLAEWFQNHPEPNCKLAVCADSQEVFDEISAFCNEHNRSFCLIRGGIPKKKRNEYIRALASPQDKRYEIGMLSYKTCAVGVTISPDVYTMLIIQLMSNPTVLEQMEARCHRIGAVHPVDIYWLVATNSHDMSMMRSVQSKVDSNSQVLDDEKRDLGFDEDELDSYKRALLCTGIGIELEESQAIRITPLPEETIVGFLTRCSRPPYSLTQRESINIPVYDLQLPRIGLEQSDVGKVFYLRETLESTSKLIVKIKVVECQKRTRVMNDYFPPVTPYSYNY